MSYVGTGTYGASNPCSITSRFPINILFCIGYIENEQVFQFYDNRGSNVMISSNLNTSYKLGNGFSLTTDGQRGLYGKKSEDGKTFSWYTTLGYPIYQANESGIEYFFIAFG